MKGKTKYTDEPIGKVRVIDDFLPSPEELALKKGGRGDAGCLTSSNSRPDSWTGC